MKRVLAVALPLAVLGLFALAGCEDDASGSSAQTAVSLASSEADPDQFFADIVAAQREAGSAHLEISADSDRGSLSVAGDIALADDLIDSTALLTVGLDAMGLGQAEVRLVDGTAYAKVGALTGGKFIVVDLADMTALAPVKELVEKAQNFDRAGALKALGDAVESFEPSGAPTKLDGVEAQGYDIVLDLTKIDVPRDEAKSHDHPEKVALTVFVGPDHLVRRVTADLEGTSLAANFSQWGEPVDVSAPASDQVSDLDISAFLRGFSGFGDH